jgi:hypothetical protein
MVSPINWPGNACLHVNRTEPVLDWSLLCYQCIQQLGHGPPRRKRNRTTNELLLPTNLELTDSRWQHLLSTFPATRRMVAEVLHPTVVVTEMAEVERCVDLHSRPSETCLHEFVPLQTYVVASGRTSRLQWPRLDR